MRKVWPSAVVSPMARTSCVATCSARSNAARSGSVEHEQHVDVGRVARARGRRAGPCRSPRTALRARATAARLRGWRRRGARARCPTAVEIGEPEDVARADAEQLAALEAAESVAACRGRPRASRACRAHLRRVRRACGSAATRRRRRGRRGSRAGGAGPARAHGSTRGSRHVRSAATGVSRKRRATSTTACNPRSGVAVAAARGRDRASSRAMRATRVATAA